MSTLYEINCTGITCSSCGTKVKKNVSKLSGVSEVSVNVLDGKVIVRITEGTRIESVVEELKSLSFGVSAAPTKVVQNDKQSTVREIYFDIDKNIAQNS